MTLRITKTNVSGFSASQAEIPDDDQAQTYVNSAYEDYDVFSIDLVFEGQYEVTEAGTAEAPGETTFVYANAVDVTSSFDWSSIDVTYSKPNAYTVRLVGAAKNVFTNQFYEFKMADYTTKILPPNHTETFFGLTHYQMPSPTRTMKTYPFSVIIPAPAAASTDPLLGGGGFNAGPYYNAQGNLIAGTTVTETVDMKQWLYWRYQVAVANIAALNDRGLK